MASSWKKHLHRDEKLVAEFGVGKGYLRFLLIFGLVTLPVILGFFILGRYFYLLWGRKYAFTSNRIISLEGWFVTHLVSIDYSQVTDVQTRRNIFDRYITATGTVIINTAGQELDEITLNEVEDPHGKVTLLHHLIEKDESEG